MGPDRIEAGGDIRDLYFYPLIQRITTVSACQIGPGSCGCWPHRLLACEPILAPVRLHCRFGTEASRIGVQGGHKSTNVTLFSKGPGLDLARFSKG